MGWSPERLSSSMEAPAASFVPLRRVGDGEKDSTGWGVAVAAVVLMVVVVSVVVVRGRCHLIMRSMENPRLRF